MLYVVNTPYIVASQKKILLIEWVLDKNFVAKEELLDPLESY